jgi:uncharacterized membrane-anchored protein YjiN (DUF445 family)
MKKITKVKSSKKVSNKQPKTTVPDRCCCERKEAKRILKANIGKDPMESSDILFAHKFITALLKEQDELEDVNVPDKTTSSSPDDFTPEKNKEDFENSLEKETEPDQFDVDGISSDVTIETINKVKEWSAKLLEFETFLNAPTENSLHRILADSDRGGSILKGITRKASDSITRISGEIAKLKEVLNSFINTAPKKISDSAESTGTIGQLR